MKYLLKLLVPFILLNLLLRPFHAEGKNNPSIGNIDITYYHLQVQVIPSQQYIKGINDIHFTAAESTERIALQLDSHLQLDTIISIDPLIEFSYKRKSSQILLQLKKKSFHNQPYVFKIFYSGKPIKAANAPWDGGFVWSKDSLNHDWIGVACEGQGAAIWWPCKDTPSDEPDSMKISVTCPASLVCVSNGNLTLIEKKQSENTYHWKVSYPINNYNVTINLGNYSHFSDTLYRIDNTKLALDYYVLKYNLTKAKDHFKQVKTILTCYEKYFGPYPFQRDGYALVETPYWGMEHQSAIAYGNNYKNNMGPFDFIIAHETAHEWWGNSITAKTMGELWIHEAFATYAESLLMEDELGKEESINYLLKQKNRIKNEKPMLSYTTQAMQEGTDIYYKGTWMLHTLRHCVNNDSIWFNTILNISIANKHKIIPTEILINYFNNKLEKNLTPLFNQYLYTTKIPQLNYSYKKEKDNSLTIDYHWENVVEGFNMPIIIEVNKKQILLPADIKTKSYNLGVIDKKIVTIQTQLQYIEVVEVINKN